MAREWRLLLLWVVLVALGTQHPFVLDWRPVTVPSDTFFVLRLKGLDPPFNVLMFLPLGALLSRKGWSLWAATLAGFCASSAIELAQHFVAFRVPVAEDLFFNTVGAHLGARYLPVVEHAAAWLERPLVRGTIVVLTTSFILWSAAPPPLNGHLWFWEHDAELIVGREQPGNYPFRGEVHEAQVLLAGMPAWTWSKDGEGRFSDLSRRIETRGSFTIEVDVTPPPEPRDDVLRRIFVYSAGVQRRNFMLASRGDRLVFRVRTRVTPIVGLFPDGDEPLELPMPKERARVRVAYEPGLARAWVDGELVAEEHFSLPEHNGVRCFWLPRNALGVWLYAFSAGLVVAAGVAGLVRRRTAIVAALAVGGLVEILQLALFDRGVDYLSFVPLILGALLGAWTAARE